MSKRDYTKGGYSFPFTIIPKDVITSPSWRALPHSARALAVDLMAQYTGKNNGRLCPAWSVMQLHGWKSKETLDRAKRALVECPYVVKTREGHPPRTAEWIAFTWWTLDFDRSMDVDPKRFPYLNFVAVKRTDPNVGRGAQLSAVSVPRKS